MGLVTICTVSYKLILRVNIAQKFLYGENSYCARGQAKISGQNGWRALNLDESNSGRHPLDLADSFGS